MPAWVLVLPVALALVVRMAELVRPGQLFGVTHYDDGVYVGQILRLLHGSMPYRNYIAVQPPGLMVLLAPFAAVGNLWGSDGALAACRLVTVGVDVANVVLVGRLVRHRGRGPQALAMTALALYPAALSSSATVLLEPYLNLFCLLAALALFDRGHLAGRRRIVVGGILLGVAGTIKIFAVLPLLALLLLWVFRHRNRVMPLLGGCAVGFLAVSLPFAGAAPRSFFHEAVVDQLQRKSPARTPGWVRMAELSGTTIFGAYEMASVFFGVALLLLVGGLVALHRGRSRGLTDLEQYAVVSLAVVLAAFWWTGTFYGHYAAFVGPFGATILACSLSSLRLDRAFGRRLAVALAVVAAAAVALVELRPVNATPPVLLAGSLDRVPQGACLVADNPAYLLAANRFSATPGCPRIVDTFGTTMVESGGDPPQVAGARNDQRAVLWWEGVLGKASFLVMSANYSHQLPSTPAFRAWLNHSYRAIEVLPGHSGSLYERR